jgi:hypothetical protein
MRMQGVYGISRMDCGGTNGLASGTSRRRRLRDIVDIVLGVGAIGRMDRRT